MAPTAVRTLATESQSNFIQDLDTENEATFTEFLYEVLSHRDRLKRQLGWETLEKLRDPSEEVFIATVAGAGFEFMVLLLAIQGLGAIVVPLSMFHFYLHGVAA